MKIKILALSVFSILATQNAISQTTKQDVVMTEKKDVDPYIWLEDVTGEKQLEWVRAHNQKTENALASTARFKEIKQAILKILNSTDKIAYVSKRGDFYYNFWIDDNHKQGVWRRTTWEEYQKPNPKWEILLDIDDLNKKENENWVWHGVDCLHDNDDICIVSLSRGGSDADVSREFNIATKSFVENGYYRPESKGSISFINKNLVYLDSTDAGKTDSGYPRSVRLWKRGTPIQSAKTLYEVDKSHVGVGSGFDYATNTGYVTDIIDFYNNVLFVHNVETNELTKVEGLPTSMTKAIYKEYLILQPKEDWINKAKTYKAGSYLVAKLKDWQQGKRDVQLLFEPTKNISLQGMAWTKNYVVINTLDDVKNKLIVLSKNDWKQIELDGLPKNGNIVAESVDDDNSDDIWLTVSGFTTPVSLYRVDLSSGASTKVKSMPSFFKESDFVVEQNFATSKDGTKIPYFLVHHKDMKADGKNPTLLYGYGGFEVSLTPYYSPDIGVAWLSRTSKEGRHGVYVLANIRGGGEYGPSWHKAALKENRHKAYEDFAAVASDLIARKITSPKQLGVQGGSNGGLLTGNMLTQYPELFGAVVTQVPLLDMKRYTKLLAGASWVAEYGDPDKPEEWAFLKKFSPYHLFDAKKDYPPVFLTTSTKDDRVHPAHARKMMAKLIEANKPAYYYENIEGGHDGAANNEQGAYMSALVYEFLWKELTK